MIISIFTTSRRNFYNDFLLRDYVPANFGAVEGRLISVDSAQAPRIVGQNDAPFSGIRGGVDRFLTDLYDGAPAHLVLLPGLHLPYFRLFRNTILKTGIRILSIQLPRPPSWSLYPNFRPRALGLSEIPAIAPRYNCLRGAPSPNGSRIYSPSMN